MRTIPTLATATLPARAVFARDWAGGWLIVTDDPAVQVVDPALATITASALAAVPVDVTTDATGAQLVVAFEDALIARSGHAETWRVAGEFLACRHAGPRIWTAERRPGGIELARRDPDTGAVRRLTSIDDPFGDSAVMFFPHPDPRAVIAWVAAGQDGQAAWVIVDDGDGLTATAVEPRDRLPPVFTPTGDAYLSAGPDILEYLAWPGGLDLDALQWSDEDDGGDAFDDPAGDYVIYVPGGYAIWASANGRLHLIDLAALVVIDELVIDEHPLRTIAELYPQLAEDTPATDFEGARPGPDGLVLTIHAGLELAVSRLVDWSPDPERVP